MTLTERVANRDEEGSDCAAIFLRNEKFIGIDKDVRERSRIERNRKEIREASETNF